MSVESSAQAAEPTRGLAERFPFIATPATNPALPLLPPEGPEQKPDVRHERDRCVSAWVKAATIEGAEPLPVGTGRSGGTTGDGGVVLAADTPMQLAQHARNWRIAGRSTSVGRDPHWGLRRYVPCRAPTAFLLRTRAWSARVSWPRVAGSSRLTRAYGRLPERQCGSPLGGPSRAAQCVLRADADAWVAWQGLRAITEERAWFHGCR